MKLWFEYVKQEKLKCFQELRCETNVLENCVKLFSKSKLKFGPENKNDSKPHFIVYLLISDFLAESVKGNKN